MAVGALDHARLKPSLLADQRTESRREAIGDSKFQISRGATDREGKGNILSQTEAIAIKAPPTEARTGYGAGEAPRWVDYSKCVHCGLCLNTCPTYRELGVEMDSPRGRIYQMIQVERGRLPLGESFVRHIDLCLDCRACETACPSGVEYGKLVEAARGQIEKYYKRPPLEALFRKLFFYELLPHRRRLALAGRLLRIYQRSGIEKLVTASRLLGLFPGNLESIARLAPRMENPFFTTRLGAVVPAVGPRRYRVAFAAGCIANLAFARMNDATVRVLTRNGCEVVIPAEQGCCGALHVHAGIRPLARELAKRNISTFLAEDFDAIISNAAGCGAVLKEYSTLFAEEDHDFYEPARRFSSKVRDITEFLASIDFNRNFAAMKVRATYQDPCHLGHAQRIQSAPRKLLAAVPGLELVELKESEICCGSAGIYNVAHNEMAERLLVNKMRRIKETGADLILTANPGCLLQLRSGVARSSRPDRRVLHVVELLDSAYA
jgi:glycolate oxidase iron-sulfur subunit